jgi:methylmalonyl-CoA mutase N-terminal domain/subunit
MKKIIYTQEDLKNFSPEKELSYPGEFPFTRGVYPEMYSKRLWTMRQYAGYGSVEESNKRYKYLLSQGQTGLSVAFDLPTQMGYDSDHPLVQGEVGKTGVAIDSLEDMELLFKGIPLESVSVSMTINSTAPIILAMYIVIAEKRGIPLHQLRGTVQNDVLKEYIARGTYIFSPKGALKLAIDIIEYCTKNLPKWNPISISGYHIREAGSTLVQEVAFTFANAITYVEETIARGLEVDQFAPRLSFFFNSHNQFFEEIAKFRVSRRLWAKIMKHRFKAKNLNSYKLRFHTQTAGSTLTSQQPMNNVIRVTLQALASILGGTQSLHTNSKDEALALPTEESAKLALRTQQIIAYETGIPEVVDPLGGSYYIESLTNKIEKEVVSYLKEIEALGGAISAIEKGYFQKKIQQSAYEYQKKIETEEKIIVGVNKFQEKEEKKIEILKIPEKTITTQLESLKKLKQKRDNQKVREKLKQLEKESKRNVNLMPNIIEAVKVYATVGEIVEVLKKEMGEYKEKKEI